MKKSDYPSWLVSVEQAKKLKELRFNEKTFIYVCIDKDTNEIVSGFLLSLSLYDNLKGIRNSNLNKNTGLFELCIPTFEQVFEWFRKKDMFHSIHISKDLLHRVKFFEAEIRDKNADIICIISKLTYEEARKALINKLIELYETNINI